MKIHYIGGKQAACSLPITILFFICCCQTFSAQNDSSGAIKIMLQDKHTKEVIPFANVVLYNSAGKELTVSTTNMDGETYFKKLSPGLYDLKCLYIGYQPMTMKNVVVGKGKTAYVKFFLSPGEGVNLEEVMVVGFSVPLIDPDTRSGQTIAREDYRNSSSGGVAHRSSSVRGGREAGTTYFVDGCKVFATPNLPQQSTGQLSVITGGVPASRGDNDPEILNVGEINHLAEKAPAPIIDPAESEVTKAGVLTAGEINDFKKWDLWKSYSAPVLERYRTDWNLFPGERYVLQLINEDRKAMAGCPVVLKDELGSPVWKAMTDNTGKAELWSGFSNTPRTIKGEIVASVNDKEYSLKNIKPFKEGINVLKVEADCQSAQDLDILFMVDATSSMDDEISYLKAEMNNVLENAVRSAPGVQIRTGALFYRCSDNSYITRASGFSSSIKTTVGFIKDQQSGEGGVEAVEVALSEAIHGFAWKEGSVKLLFIVMDEPPSGSDSVVASLHKSISVACEKGIRIIPLIASGGTSENEQKSMEYLMRCMALATNGSYAFLTDDSGVGLKHARPVTPQIEVEFLNALLLRLIREFSSSSCEVTEPLVKNGQTSMSITNNDTLLTARTEAPGKALRFFPNPCQGELTLECEKAIGEFFLCDINGKILERLEMNGEKKKQVDLRSYPAGMYLIRFKSEMEWVSGKVVLK